MSTKRNSQIKYFAREEQFPFFFSEHLSSVVNTFSNRLGDNTQVWVYPDATVKPNGLPTGTVCFSTPQNTMLMPFILRDPGCGYLTFKIELTESLTNNWHHATGQLLEELINNTEFRAKNFPILNRVADDLLTQVQFTAEEKELLQKDFMEVTNTVEIRSILETKQDIGLSNNDLIGFVHTGSHIFPRILADRFVYDICEYADQNKLFSLDDIKQGMVGVPFNSTLGQEYYQWLQAAMNHAVNSRQAIYQAIKKTLETTLPCKVTMLQDTTHAGIFTKKTNDNDIIYTTRGVQDISNGLNLLAGHRETIAALVMPDVRANDYHNFFAHGTACRIRDNHDYTTHFQQDEIEYYTQLAHNTFYNSNPQYNECLPYTYNLLASLEYFEQIKLAKTAALLGPLINIQSEWLKN